MFVGKLMTADVVSNRYKQSALISKLNGDCQFQEHFSIANMNMGTFYFLDGMKVQIFVGNENTCERCHQGRSKCPG